MFAVCRINGKQYLVSEGEIIKIEKITGEEGEELLIKEVLLVSNGENSEIGQPILDKVIIMAKVKGHGKDKKVAVFKYKKRKGYRKKQGHRQSFTEIVIGKITGTKISPIKSVNKKSVKAVPKNKNKKNFIKKKVMTKKKVK